MRQHSFRYSLADLTGFVLVAAMAFAPLSAGVTALGDASMMAVVGICAVAALGALPRRGKGRAFRLRFAASCSLFLLISGWFQTPGPPNRPDLGRVVQSGLAIVVGILGALLAGRWN